MSEIENGRLGLYGTEHSKCNCLMTLGFKGINTLIWAVLGSELGFVGLGLSWDVWVWVFLHVFVNYGQFVYLRFSLVCVCLSISIACREFCCQCQCNRLPGKTRLENDVLYNVKLDIKFCSVMCADGMLNNNLCQVVMVDFVLHKPTYALLITTNVIRQKSKMAASYCSLINYSPSHYQTKITN